MVIWLMGYLVNGYWVNGLMGYWLFVLENLTVDPVER